MKLKNGRKWTILCLIFSLGIIDSYLFNGYAVRYILGREWVRPIEVSTIYGIPVLTYAILTGFIRFPFRKGPPNTDEKAESLLISIGKVLGNIMALLGWSLVISVIYGVIAIGGGKLIKVLTLW